MNTNNTVRPVDSINIVTVVTDETQVNVTRPVTNVVRVVGPGPIGPVGPQGIQGETGLTVTDLFVRIGDDLWSSTASLQLSASLIVSQSITGLSGFTGSLLGTAATASYFAGYGNSTVLISQHETYNTFTGSIQTQVDGISNATSSYVLNSVTSSMLQPYVLTSVTQSMLRPYVLTSVTQSMLQPYVLTSVTQSMLQPYVLTSVTSSMLQPYVLTNVTSSMLQPYVLTTITGSMLQPYVLTSATSSMIVSGALTASFVNTLNQQVVITGSLNISGSVFIPALTNDGQLYVLTYNTASGQVYYTGSRSIGDVPKGASGQIQYNNNLLLSGVPTLIYTDNLLKATGSFSGSFNGSGSGNFDGTFIGNFTGSLLGTAATASFVTSSNVLGPHSFNSVVSASHAVTASYYVETDPIFVAKSASLATTGSNTFKGNQNISGSVNILIPAGAAYGMNENPTPNNVFYSYTPQDTNTTAVQIGWIAQVVGGGTYTVTDVQVDTPFAPFISITLSNPSLTLGYRIGVNFSSPAKLWKFNTDGTTDVPGNINLSGSIIFGNSASIRTNFYGAGGIDIVADPAGYAELASNNTQSFVWVTNDGAFVGTNWDTNAHQWEFRDDGYFVLPQVQSLTKQAGILSAGDIIIQADEAQSWRFASGSGLLTAPGTIQAPSFSGSFTGSLLGTSATASFVTSSNVQGPYGMNSILSASYALTSSYVNALTQDVTVSGSLFISGSTVQTGNVTLQGNHVQTGTAILSGSNVITGSLSLTGNASISGSIYLKYPTTSSIYFSGSTATNVGRLVWNEDDGTLDLGLKGGNVTLQIGQEEVARVVNKTGGDLLEANYQVVRITGAQGNRIEVGLAKGDGDSNSLDTLGLVTETILNNQSGFVTTKGLVRGIDTRGTLQSETWNEGDSLFLSPTTFGGITNIPPIAPSHSVRLGYVVQSSPNGSIFVKVDNGYEIDELHNVKINTSSLSYGDLLAYGTNVWQNTKQLTGSYGLTGSLNVTGSTKIIGSSVITGSMTVSGSLTANFAYLTGSLLGTAATASFVTSSNVQGPYGMNSVVSASHAVTVRSYAQLIGDGATSNITVNHGLGTNDIHITVYSASGNFENIIPDIHRTDTNTIQVRFVNPPTLNQYRVYISV